MEELKDRIDKLEQDVRHMRKLTWFIIASLWLLLIALRLIL